jgi:hypothetical protein
MAKIAIAIFAKKHGKFVYFGKGSLFWFRDPSKIPFSLHENGL